MKEPSHYYDSTCSREASILLVGALAPQGANCAETAPDASSSLWSVSNMRMGSYPPTPDFRVGHT